MHPAVPEVIIYTLERIWAAVHVYHQLSDCLKHIKYFKISQIPIDKCA